MNFTAAGCSARRVALGGLFESASGAASSAARGEDDIRIRMRIPAPPPTGPTRVADVASDMESADPAWRGWPDPALTTPGFIGVSRRSTVVGRGCLRRPWTEPPATTAASPISSAFGAPDAISNSPMSHVV